MCAGKVADVREESEVLGARSGRVLDGGLPDPM